MPLLYIWTLIWEVEFWQCANYWGTIEGLNIPVFYISTGDSSASLEESVWWAGRKSGQHQCCYLHSQTLWKVRIDSFSDFFRSTDHPIHPIQKHMSSGWCCRLKGIWKERMIDLCPQANHGNHIREIWMARSKRLKRRGKELSRTERWILT